MNVRHASRNHGFDLDGLRRRALARWAAAPVRGNPIERLEPRRLLAGNAYVNNGSIIVFGDSLANDISVSMDGTDVVARVDAQSWRFAAGPQSVYVYAGGGNDTVRHQTPLDGGIHGEGGNDTLYGSTSVGGQQGWLDGGDGDDLLQAGWRQHATNWQTGDFLEGVVGNDTLIGNRGNDNLNGWIGADSIDGGSGSDFVEAGDGNDTIQGGDFGDFIRGGSGNDHITGDNPDNWNNEDGGNDRIFAGEGNDTVFGAGRDDEIWDEAGNDSINGGDGADTMRAGAGADRYEGGDNGWQSWIGGDLLTYGERTAVIRVDADGVADDGASGEFDNVLLGGIERIEGGSNNDSIVGSAMNETLYGLAGNDTLRGGGGNDRLYGGDSVRDDAFGTTYPVGNDALHGDAGNDSLYAGNGNDAAFGGTGNDFIDPGTGADYVEGDDGADTASYQRRNAAVRLTLDNVANDGVAGEADNLWSDVENLVGGSGSDYLLGNASANRLDGGGQQDTLIGLAGNDSLFGGEGVDRMDGGLGADTFSGGSASFDVVDYSNRTSALVLDLDGVADDGALGEGDRIGTDVEQIIGGSGNDRITGNGLANSLSGGGGNDSIFSGGGNDTLVGGTGADQLFGQDGNDTLFGRDGTKDTLDGGAGTGDRAQRDAIDFVLGIESFIA